MRTGYQNRAITPENNRGFTRAENRAATARRQEETRERAGGFITHGYNKGKARDGQPK